MTLFYYVFLIAYHISVPTFRKCMDTSRNKKSFGWERSRSYTACCTSTSDLKYLRSIASLRGPKTWKFPGRPGLANTEDVEDSRKTNFGLLQQLNRQYGAEYCHVKTKFLYPEVRVVWTWLQVADDSLSDLHKLHCSVFSLGIQLSKINTRTCQKRVSITFPADGCVPDQVAESLLQK
jgi:hypothetical protein